MSVVVTLTEDECHVAFCQGIFRRLQKIMGRRGDRAQNGRSTWDNEMESAAAELAFCKHVQHYWTGMERCHATDAGEVEVRWTNHQDSGGLIIYEHDDKDRIFVLVDGFAPNYRFVGWLRAKDGMRDEWRPEWLNGRGFCVPREHLKTSFRIRQAEQ